MSFVGLATTAKPVHASELKVKVSLFDDHRYNRIIPAGEGTNGSVGYFDSDSKSYWWRN
ncbi:hypothetical protein [Lactobacillus psittaci]|uniref:hypothetical protein n=1 Tax=Lactobacillus psittaci TaxID=116089 RepID=UPI00138F4978|nr:hypothetical protein [Lactobacillus psittaci]